jgi:Ca-activated chloride channel family protein
MNRTTVFLGLAGALALLALVIGVPRATGFKGFHPDPVDPAGNDPVVVADGSIRMEARLSHPYIGTGSSDVFATVDLTGAQVPGATRSPVNVALVIDRSGSMAGEKLFQAKQAARKLVEQLGDADRIAVIHFGSDVRTFQGARATGSTKEQLLQYIDGIEDEGGTNISDGLDAGKVELLKAHGEYQVNRLILMSDGEPTEGATAPGDLLQLAREIHAQGVTLSAIGLGTDFNEDLMQSLAENGSGAYAYLRDGTQLATIFQKDLQQASTTIAREVSLKLDLPEGVELGDVLGYRAQQAGRTVTVPMPDFSAGQVERVVVRLSVQAGQAGKAVDVTKVNLQYADLLKGGAAGAQARLSAMVTEQREEIARHQDKQATVYAARAQSAANMNQAADLLRKGDKGGARRLLLDNEMIFRNVAPVAGAPAVAADVAEQQAVMKEFDEAADGASVEHSVKAAKVKARKDFGRIGSTY